MGIAALLSVFTAVFLALINITARRAVTKVTDAGIGVLISVPAAVPFYLVILAAIGQANAIVGFSWQGYLWLAGAGLFHFVIGRRLNYRCIQAVGANLATILVGISPLVTAAIGIWVLGETFTWKLFIGVLLVTFGLMSIGVTPQTFRHGGRLFSNISRKALFTGLGAGAAWGISPIFIKEGFAASNPTPGLGFPIAAAFISHLAAAIVMGFSLRQSKRRGDLFHMNGMAAIAFVLSGLSGGMAHLLRYTALSMAPASVVVPIMYTAPIFTIFFSYLLNRKLEVFSVPVIIGMVAMVVGSILVL
ncbi:MAG: DMT family transporter [Chloroflexi bacterium]|nr:DMT family transporter [Chloroflexota bacterium]